MSAQNIYVNRRSTHERRCMQWEGSIWPAPAACIAGTRSRPRRLERVGSHNRASPSPRCAACSNAYTCPSASNDTLCEAKRPPCSAAHIHFGSGGVAQWDIGEAALHHRILTDMLPLAPPLELRPRHVRDLQVDEHDPDHCRPEPMRVVSPCPRLLRLLRIHVIHLLVIVMAKRRREDAFFAPFGRLRNSEVVRIPFTSLVQRAMVRDGGDDGVVLVLGRGVDVAFVLAANRLRAGLLACSTDRSEFLGRGLVEGINCDFLAGDVGC